MRKTKKTLALLLTLAMVLTLFAGVAQASASVSIATAVPTIMPAANQTVGRIDISTAAQKAVSVGDQTVVRVMLPSGVTWDADPAAGNVSLDAGASGARFTAPGRADDNRTLTFTIASGAVVEQIRLSGMLVDLPTTFRGDLNVDVTVTGQTAAADFVWEQKATVRIATVAAAGTTSRAVSTPNAVRGEANQLVGNIEIRENIAGSFVGNGDILLTLPPGVTFADNPTLTSSPAGSTTLTWVAPPKGLNTATIDIVALAGSAARTITVENIRLNVDNTVIDGSINVQIGNVGLATFVTNAIVSVANVGLVGNVTVSRQGDLPAEWNLGRVNRAIGTIRLSESVRDALVAGRVVTLTLPVGYTWHTAPINGNLTLIPTATDGGRTLTYWTNLPDNTAARTDFDLTGGKINANAATAVPGDVVVNVAGSAGAAGTAVVARSRRSVTATAVTTPNVRVNSLNQTVGSVSITEVAAGTFVTGTLTITFPVGTSIAAAGSASVSVASGTAPTVTSVTAATNVITVALNAAFVPSQPATITISGIRINTDGTPMRPVTVDVAGTSILDTGATGNFAVAIADAVGANFADDLLVANVVTATASRTVFTVGSTNFTVDGVTRSFITPARSLPAPFIQAGRTLVSLRAAANAVGITDANIIWDAATRTVTLIREDRIAQFTVGSRVVIANGMPIPMLAPMVNVEGYSMLPVGYVARIFGATPAWDPAARTVTVTTR